MNRYGLLLVGLLLEAGQAPLCAGYDFDFWCRSDTVRRVQPGGPADFHFTLANTGTEPDVYEFDCRVVQPVPGWSVIYCLHGLCTVPGVLMYDTLAAGASDTTIEVTVFTTSTQGAAVVNLRVRSLGNPSLAESINVRTIVGSGIEEQLPVRAAEPLLRIVPNPVQQQATVSFGPAQSKSAAKAPPGRLELLDALGRRVQLVSVTTRGSASLTWLRPPGLKPGVYLFRLSTDRTAVCCPVVLGP